MKRLFLATILVVAGMLNVHGYTNIDGILYDLNSTKATATVASRETSEDNPRSYSGLTIVNIPEKVTFGFTTYTVTGISDHAFDFCIGIEVINIPKTVTNISDNRTFRGCSSLVAINVDKDNPKYVSVDGVLFNKDMTTLVCYPGGKAGDYVIPTTVTHIGFVAFERCHKLTSVTIPNTVTYIEEGAFYYCTRLKSIYIPSSVVKTDYGLFRRCEGINIYCQAKTEPAGWSSIWDAAISGGYNIYWDCRSLTLSVNNEAYGTAIGSGFYVSGSIATIGVDCSNQYHFVGWSEDGKTIVNTEQNRTIRVVSDMNLTAIFEKHTIAVDTEVPATCLNSGLTGGTHCSVCNVIITKQCIIPALGHTEVVDAGYPATCSSSGMTDGKHCSVCHMELVAQDPIPAKEHTVVVDSAVQATCNHIGLTAGSHCSVCGEILQKREDIPFVDHNVVEDAPVAPTCSHVGLTTGKHCSYCNLVIEKQDTIAMLEHTVVIDDKIEATCTQTGLTAGKHCSVCNSVLVKPETIPMKDHTMVVDSAVAATCTMSGLTEGLHCSVCNKQLTQQTNIPATGHVIVVDNAIPATCTSAGLTEGKHCSACDTIFVKRDIVPATGHAIVIDSAVAATCTHEGLSIGMHCSVCNEVLQKQDAIAQLSHEFTYYIYNNDATFDEDGTETAVCDYGCGEKDTHLATGTRLTTGIEPVESSAVNIYAHHNVIVVENADSDIFVYDAMGRLIARRDVACNASTEITMQDAGIFIVKTGVSTIRVAIVK